MESLEVLPGRTAGNVYVVFDAPPSAVSGRFIELEDAYGRGIKRGQWIIDLRRDAGPGWAALELPDSAEETNDSQASDVICSKALAHVRMERLRQEYLKTLGRFSYTCADPEMSKAEKLAVLVEEVGEVARQVITQGVDSIAHDTSGSPDGLRAELVQVAAVAVAWVESLVVEEGSS